MQSVAHGLIHVVDDNAFIQDFLCELIEGVGYEVQAFADPKTYIAYVYSGEFIKPQVTFVDVIMPYMSGYEMISSILPDKPDMRFVVMSGELDIRAEHKNMACMYLRKPFYPICIEEVLNKLSKCDMCGASEDIDCSSIDHRGFYELKDWTCPGTIEIKPAPSD